MMMVLMAAMNGNFFFVHDFSGLRVWIREGEI